MLRSWLPLGIAALGLAGCGSDSSGGGGGGGGGTGGDGGIPAAPQTVSLVADSNRDGKVDFDDQKVKGDQWDTTLGASFIANLDDDDVDGVRDCEDEIINGDGDKWDLANFIAAAWPEVEDGATGRLKIDAEAAESIRIFKVGLDGSTKPVLGSMGACRSEADCTYTLEHTLTTDEIRGGITFYIEARRFRGMALPTLPPDDQVKKLAWTGFVDITYSIEKADKTLVTSEYVPDGIAKLKMRAAPWVLLGSLGPHDTLYSSDAAYQFVDGNIIATEAAGVAYHQIPDSYGAPAGWGDWWTEDIFQTGWTGFPGENGSVRGMRIFNARPWGRAPFSNPSKEQRLQYAPIRWILGDAANGREPGALGPDVGGAAFYDQKHEGYGHTQDSHGNHDLIPPHEGYPLGRIFTGNKAYAETQSFYEAQQVQGPPLVTDTTWLAVEHVDEFFHFVPAKTARGWKLLVASPALMTKMLEDLKAKGNGSAVLHQGKGAIYQKSVDETLGDANLNTWAQESDVKIQGHIDEMKQETGLTDAEIIELPTWFEDLGGNEKVAWNPGTVNMRMMGNVADVQKPFGPLLNGEDPFEQQVRAELEGPKNELGSDGQGLKVYFTNGWDYHAAMGEIHCATNESSPAPFDKAFWWESGK